MTVRCLSSTINLEVTQDTNPVDIAYTTAKLITHKINPGTSVVFECYEELGLERRLRCYESIRDVMNSWDRDHQNSLLIMSYCSPPDTADLELASVPKTDDPPTGFTFQLHHSARPGKWNKRWITLMDSGQIFAAKRPESKSTDKDSAILCHMSDFDIFTPSQNDVKHLKPPKKFCYAIKSQQKTSVFPDGANFIHFFSVEEEDLAQRFHELVFGWRSWYLANKRLNTQGPKSSSTLRRSITSATRNSSSISRRSSCRERPSGEKNSYHIGESKPLIDMQRFNKPIDEFGKGASSVRKSVDAQSTKSRGPPPSLPQPPQSGSEFLAGGLLGDSYDRRKQADAITAVKGVEGPFTEGPSLLNGLRKPPTPPTEKTEPNSWFPSALEHSARSRNQSRPPQFRRPTTADTAQLHRDKLLSPSSAANMPVPDALRSRPSQRQGVGGGVKPPVGSPLINFATGGATSNQPMPSRSSSNGAPNSGRHRSHSTATTRSGGQRYVSPDQPPIPPLPYRSMRRPDGRMHTEPTRGHNGCPQEPLINRVK